MGLMSGFLAGAGGQLVDIADRRIAKYDAEDLAAQRQAAEIAKEKRMEEHAIRSEGRTDARDTAKRGLMRAEAIAEEDRKYEPSYVQRELDRAEKAKLAGGETQRELDRLKLQNDTTPEALKAKRAEKLATDIDHGAGLRALQIQDANLTLTEKKKVNALIAEAETTKDPVRRAEIVQALTVRGVIKPDKNSATEEKTWTDEKGVEHKVKEPYSPGGGGKESLGLPTVGQVVGDKEFIGGNPRDPKSWKPVSESGADDVKPGKKGFINKLLSDPEPEYIAINKVGKISYEKNPRYVPPPQNQDDGQFRKVAIPNNLNR